MSRTKARTLTKKPRNKTAETSKRATKRTTKNTALNVGVEGNRQERVLRAAAAKLKTKNLTPVSKRLKTHLEGANGMRLVVRSAHTKAKDGKQLFGLYPRDLEFLNTGKKKGYFLLQSATGENFLLSASEAQQHIKAKRFSYSSAKHYMVHASFDAHRAYLIYGGLAVVLGKKHSVAA